MPASPCATPSEPVGSRGRSLTLGSHNRLRERGSTRSNTTLAPASRAMHGRYALFHRIGTRRRDARKRRQAPPTKLGGTDGTIARFAAPNRCRSRSLSSGSRFGAGNGARLPLHRRNADCSCVARSVFRAFRHCPTTVGTNAAIQFLPGINRRIETSLSIVSPTGYPDSTIHFHEIAYFTDSTGNNCDRLFQSNIGKPRKHY